MQKYFVVILDIIDSTKVEDRDAITFTLTHALSKINSNYDECCWALFEITKGDEVAAVLLNAHRIYEILKIFQEILSPHRFRVVVYYDTLTAGIDTHRSTIIDGPAFYRANTLMIDLKKTQKYFVIKSGFTDIDVAIESLVNLLLWRWNNLTELQRIIISQYQKIRNQQKVAEKIGRTQQQIQDSLSRCRWEIIDNAEKTVGHLLTRIDSLIESQ